MGKLVHNLVSACDDARTQRDELQTALDSSGAVANARIVELEEEGQGLIMQLVRRWESPTRTGPLALSMRCPTRTGPLALAPIAEGCTFESPVMQLPVQTG